MCEKVKGALFSLVENLAEKFPMFKHHLEMFRDIRSRKFPFRRKTVFIGDRKYPLPWLEWRVLIIVQFIRCLSLPNFIRLKNDENEEKYTIIEKYVLLWSIILIILLFVVSLLMKASAHLSLIITIAIILIVGYELVEILSANLGIIFIDRYKNGSIRSLNRSLLLIGLNYFEVIVAFAILYLATSSIGYTNCNNILTSPIDALYFSAVTITSLGCYDLMPISSWGKVLVALEPIIGLILIVIVIGAFFTFYSRKDSAGEQ